MTDLLLITDVPRLRKIFSRLTDAKNIHLRVANNLEKGAEELTAEKPGIVFVQTHLSGLSAEIILMHLKKQLGRKRTRFVLLAAADQVSNDTLRLYQGHIDTALEDEPLLSSVRETVAALVAKPAKKTVRASAAPEATDAAQQAQTSEPVLENAPTIMPAPQQSETVPGALQDEPSLEEQGITYSPRPRMSVYSEFNSSFDSAVDNMKPAAAVNEIAPEQQHDWSAADIETVETTTRSKQASFMLWLAPVIIAVVVVTIIQQKRTPSTLPVATITPPTVAAKVNTQPAATAEAAKPVTAPTVPAAVPVVAPAVQQLGAAKSAREPEAALSDKAVITAIAENRGKKEQAAKPPTTTNRPTILPDFIPRYAVDKSYPAANPGWERYKGQVTEFKVFREGGTIKAIQVIDKGGSGVPESFMKAALRQVSKNPAVVMESNEKKDGYEIQRGQTGDNLKVMFYRDDQGGKLRAFVMTWK